jgi:hypothetical protein
MTADVSWDECPQSGICGAGNVCECTCQSSWQSWTAHVRWDECPQSALEVLQIFVDVLASQVGSHGPPMDDGMSAQHLRCCKYLWMCLPVKLAVMDRPWMMG